MHNINLATVAAIGVASCMSGLASATVTITVVASSAPNYYGSPSWGTYSSNAMYALRNGLANYGGDQSVTPTAYAALGATADVGTNMVSGYALDSHCLISIRGWVNQIQLAHLQPNGVTEFTLACLWFQALARKFSSITSSSTLMAVGSCPLLTPISIISATTQPHAKVCFVVSTASWALATTLLLHQVPPRSLLMRSMLSEQAAPSGQIHRRTWQTL